MSAIAIALIVAVPTLIATSVVPILLSHIGAKQRQEEREADWQRQDAVAERAIEAVAAAEAVAEKAANVAEAQAVVSADLDAKLTRIAHQTDGLYTAALESELRALQGQAATLREVVALRDPSMDNTRTLAVIEKAELRIAELEEGLKRREQVQAELDLPTGPGGVVLGPVQVEIVNPDPVDVKIAPDEHEA